MAMTFDWTHNSSEGNSSEHFGRISTAGFPGDNGTPQGESVDLARRSMSANSKMSSGSLSNASSTGPNVASSLHAAEVSDSKCLQKHGGKSGTEGMTHPRNGTMEGDAQSACFDSQCLNTGADQEEPRHQRKSRLQSIQSALYAALVSERTERGLRVTLFLIPALFCSYHKWLGTNFPYACALLYILMEALIPPMMYGISVAGTMAFSAGVMGVALATAAWAAGARPGPFTPRWAMFLVYFPGIVLFSTWKIGKAASMTGMAALLAVYSSELPFFSGYPFIENGIHIHVDFVDMMKNPDMRYSDILQNLPLQVTQKISEAIKRAQDSQAVDEALKNFNITLTSRFGQLSGDLKPLSDKPFTVVLKLTGFDFIMDPDLWYVRLAWVGHGRLGLVQAILGYGSIAIGLYVASVLCIPQRYVEYYLRFRVTFIIRHAAHVVGRVLLDSRKSEGALSLTEAVSLGWINDEKKSGTSDLRSVSPSFYALPYGDVHRDWRTNLYPSLEAVGSNLSRVMSMKKGTQGVEGTVLRMQQQPTVTRRSPAVSRSSSASPLTSGAVTVTVKPSGSPSPSTQQKQQRRLREVTTGRQEICASKTLMVTDSLRQAIIDTDDLMPMALMAVMEPRLAAPGPFSFFAYKWIAVIRTTQQALVSIRGLWRLVEDGSVSDADAFRLLSASSVDVRLSRSSVAHSKQGSTGILEEEVEEINESEDELLKKNAFSSVAVGSHERVFERFRDKALIRRLLFKAARVYQLIAITLGLTPAYAESAQEQSLQILRKQLRSAVAGVLEEAQLKVESPARSLASRALGPVLRISLDQSWRYVVEQHAVAVQVCLVAVHFPLKLGQAAESLLEHQSVTRPIRSFLCNIAAFFLPFGVMLAVMFKSLARMLTPWHWQWWWPRAAPSLSAKKNADPINRQKAWNYYYLGTRLPWYADSDILYCARWIVGVMGLLALPLFWDGFRTWLVSGEKKSDLINELLVQPMTTKMSTWTSLGFLTTLFMTVEGTLHRAVLRAIGVLTGTFSAYVCLTVFGRERLGWHIVWICLTIFIACYIGGNPTSAVLGYHPSWGYACQLFTYQEAIIIIEAYYNVQEVNELILSRLLAQLLGISAACLISLLMFPNQMNVTIRQCIVQVVYCHCEGTLALVESLLTESSETESLETQSLEPPLRDARQTISDPRPWDDPRVFNDSGAVSDAAAPKGDKMQYVKGQEGVSLRWLGLLERSEHYAEDVKAAMDKISTHIRESVVFKELSCCRLKERWGKTVYILQLMHLHRAAWNVYLQALRTNRVMQEESRTECKLRQQEVAALLGTLRALKRMSALIERRLVEGVDWFWIPGYRGLFSVRRLMACLRRCGNWMSRRSKKRLMKSSERGLSEAPKNVSAEMVSTENVRVTTRCLQSPERKWSQWAEFKTVRDEVHEATNKLGTSYGHLIQRLRVMEGYTGNFNLPLRPFSLSIAEGDIRTTRDPQVPTSASSASIEANETDGEATNKIRTSPSSVKEDPSKVLWTWLAATQIVLELSQDLSNVFSQLYGDDPLYCAG